jgi:hypothetical protein
MLDGGLYDVRWMEAKGLEPALLNLFALLSYRLRQIFFPLRQCSNLCFDAEGEFAGGDIKFIIHANNGLKGAFQILKTGIST